MAFPLTRMRRLRRTPALRELVRETRLDAGDLVLPIFVEAALAAPQPIEAMPGVSRQPVSGALSEAAECLALGIPAMLTAARSTVRARSTTTLLWSCWLGPRSAKPPQAPT